MTLSLSEYSKHFEYYIVASVIGSIFDVYVNEVYFKSTTTPHANLPLYH